MYIIALFFFAAAYPLYIWWESTTTGMHKLWLIVKREYLTRVTRRSFILATLLTPLAFGVFIVVVGFIFRYESDDAKHIAVIDQGDILKGAIKDERNLYFKFVNIPLDTLIYQFDQYDYSGVLLIPKPDNLLDKTFRVYYYSDDKLTLDIEPLIIQKVRSSLRDYKIDQLKFDRKELEALDTKVELEPKPITPTADADNQLSGAVGAAIGFFMGIIMYMTVFIYGMMVMRSVMEEKTSRIVEVMISSVRPFQLMMGKIIGVGAVGLTQVAIWAVLLPLIVVIANLFFGFDASQMPSAAPPPEMNGEDAQLVMAQVMAEVKRISWWLIFPLFILYFLGGYFMYSSLFAAVGSAMGDDLGEGQSLTIPITIPVVLAFYIMMVAVQAPHSSLAVWSSLFPLFSPIVMPARLAFDPPAWQVALSIVLLLATAVFLVWLSGRIYRVGILMYGKKVTLKELGKWMFYRD